MRGRGGGGSSYFCPRNLCRRQKKYYTAVASTATSYPVYSSTTVTVRFLPSEVGRVNDTIQGSSGDIRGGHGAIPGIFRGALFKEAMIQGSNDPRKQWYFH